MAEIDGAPVDVNMSSGDSNGNENDNSGSMDGLLSLIDSVSKPSQVENKVETPVVKSIETPPKTDASTDDRGLERLATKEKEIRDLRAKFDSDRAEFEKQRTSLINPDDIRNNPNEVIKKLGLDEDTFMKTILFNKLPADHPLKAKLKTELSEYLRDKQIRELNEKLDSRDKTAAQTAANQKAYQEATATLDKYVDSFKGEDNTKTLPHLSTIGKKDVAKVRSMILKEMIDDAANRFARGEDGDPITHDVAASRIEKMIAELRPFFTAEQVEVPKKNSKKVVTSIKPGNPVSKTDSTSELDQMIARVLG